MNKWIIIVAAVAAIGAVVGAGFAVSAYVEKERKEARYAEAKRLYDRDFKAHMEAWSEEYDADIADKRLAAEKVYREENNIGDEIINLKAYLEATLEYPEGNRWFFDTYLLNTKGFGESAAEYRYHTEHFGYIAGYFKDPLD